MYQVGKSTSFLTPIAIWTAPSILASSVGAAATAGAGAGAAGAATAVPSSCSLVSGVSSFLRYESMSVPNRKIVSLEEFAWMANTADEDAIDGSTTVTTFGNVNSVRESGDTTSKTKKTEPKPQEVVAHAQEFLSSAKNSLSRSSDASRSSFKFSAFPMAPEFVSVSSRAMTTTGMVVAVLAVFGL